MVSLRYVREQEEAATRRARFEEARRIASALGVRRARAYAVQKKVQAVKVRNDVQKQWECEVQQQAALIDRIMYDGQAKLGEGVRAAADVMAAQRQHAAEELDAWAAERALQRERHRIACATACVTRALREEPRRSVVERKRAVRAAEDKRSRAVIARPQPSPPNFAENAPLLAGALSLGNFQHTLPRATAASGGVVVVTAEAINSRERVVRGETAAAQFSEERRQALASARETVQQGQREAAERAAAFVSQRKEAERRASEAAQRRAANKLALEQRIVAEPHPDTSFCTKELETRRAAALKGQEEAEFEQMFLRGTLPPVDEPAATVEKGRTGDEGDVDDDGMFFLPLSNVECLLPRDADVVVQLPRRPFDVRPYVEGTADDAEDDKKMALEEGSDGSSAASFAQQRTPLSPQAQPLGLTPSPPRALQASEEVAPQPVLSPPPSPLLSSPTPEKAAAVPVDVTSTGDVSPELELHHERFLRSLKALQEKLARATGGTQDDDTVDVSVCQGNVSLSTMSSLTTPARPAGKGACDGAHKDGYEETNTTITDTSGSSLSMSSVYSRSYPTMTADQLKAALLQLKSRMRSA